MSTSERLVADSRNSNSLTCQDVARQATEYLENRLAAAARAAIEQHFAACGTCKTYVDQLRLVRDSLRKLPEAQDDAKRNELTERFVRTLRDNKDA